MGMKCPACATPPRRARMIGRPRHYVLGSVAGFMTAALAGVLLTLSSIGYFGLIGAILVGYAVGSVVFRASSRLRHPAVQAIAAGSTAVGLAAGGLLAGLPPIAILRGPFLFPFLIASGAAAFFANR